MVSAVTVLGALALVGNSIGYFVYPEGVKMGIGAMINLKENGMVYPAYMKPPFPSIATYWLFAITNPREVLQGAKGNFELKGPYVYNAWISRDNIRFSDGKERIRYDSHRNLILDEEKSANMDETFWILNPIMPATLKTIRSLLMDRIPFRRVSEPIVFNSLNLILDNFKERLIQKKSARTLLQGRKIELLQSITDLAGRFGLASLVPPGPPENIFGIAHFQSKSTDQIEVYVGVGETKDKYAEVYKWKEMDKVKFWTGQCSIIEGTNGELYKPSVPAGKSLKIFLGQLCRSLILDPVSPEPVEIQDGLMALEYELSSRIYQGARSSSRNKCFCIDTRTYDCQYDGLIPMGPCFFEAPFYFSKVNMKGVDRKIRSLINDTSIEYQELSEKQSFYLDQATGSVLKADLSLLGMFKVVRQPYMRDMAKLQNLSYIPFFVASEAIELPYSVTRPLKYLQVMSENYKMVFMGGALGGAVVLLLKFTILR